MFAIFQCFVRQSDERRIKKSRMKATGVQRNSRDRNEGNS